MTNKLLTKTCEYIKIMHDYAGYDNLESRIAKKVLDGNMTDEQLSFVMDVFNDGGRMDSVQKLITPVSEKKFSTEWTTPTHYYPNPAPLDAHLSDGNPHWIYIHSPVQGRWGETYWISIDCNSSLRALPVIKSFKEYDFEVGHFYKVTCVDIIYWGANGDKKKYVYEIEECTEDEYMSNGFINDAIESGMYDKCYMEEVLRQYQK